METAGSEAGAGHRDLGWHAKQSGLCQWACCRPKRVVLHSSKKNLCAREVLEFPGSSQAEFWSVAELLDVAGKGLNQLRVGASLQEWRLKPAFSPLLATSLSPACMETAEMEKCWPFQSPKHSS